MIFAVARINSAMMSKQATRIFQSPFSSSVLASRHSMNRSTLAFSQKGRLAQKGTTSLSTYCRNQSHPTHGVLFTRIQRQCVSLGRMRQRYFSSNQSAPPDGKKSSLTWWQRWTAPREMPPQKTTKWYGEMVLLCTVFAITGSSTMFLVRPAVSNVLGLEGSFKDGPWGYRICSIVIMTPIYATLLVVTGTIFGRHAYFRHFAVKMFSRFGVPPELLDPTFHQAKATFRKW